MYSITHHYMTIGDDGIPVIEREQRSVDDSSEIAEVVREMVDAPGGRSGTTINISVSRDDSACM